MIKKLNFTVLIKRLVFVSKIILLMFLTNCKSPDIIQHTEESSRLHFITAALPKPIKYHSSSEDNFLVILILEDGTNKLHRYEFYYDNPDFFVVKDFHETYFKHEIIFK